jgi:hypothetical protein
VGHLWLEVSNFLNYFRLNVHLNKYARFELGAAQQEGGGCHTLLGQGGIHSIEEAGHGFQRAAVVAVADEECAAIDSGGSWKDRVLGPPKTVRLIGGGVADEKNL